MNRKWKTVIVDDNILKAMDIRKALEWNGLQDIAIVSCQEKLWDAIYAGRENGAEVGLIVTDMHYPLTPGAAPDEEAGFKLMERMEDIVNILKKVQMVFFHIEDNAYFGKKA